MATAVALTPDTLTANTPTPITPSPASGSHPKTGERRRIQRTLRLDALPAAMLDRVRTQRAAGRSWEQIEHDSIDWPEWDEVPEEVRAGFPDRRLPHTNLCRWYDLRVEQVRQRHEQIALAAQMLGDRLTEGGFTNLYAAIKNALGVMVFSLMDECPDQNLVREELYRLAKVVIALGRLERAEERAEREKETIGNRAPATERQETTRYQRAADRPRSSAAPAAGAPPYAGENPRPPASAREERATVERPAAIGRKEPDPAAVLRELGPDIEKLADTLISMVPAGAFVSNRART